MENELKISNSSIPGSGLLGLQTIVPIEAKAQLDETPISPMAAMMAAINANVDLAKIEKMIELQQKWDAMEARKAYTRAMAAFKKDSPEIFKDKEVGFTSQKTGGKTSYSHATLGNVTSKINAALSVHGLSAGWTTEQKEKIIIVTCKITHEMGHSESTSLTAYPDDSGNKNSIQAIGSTITYLERYTILALTGLATHDQDDDGKGADEEKEYINDEQKSTILDMIADCDIADSTDFLKWLGYESIAKIEKKSYSRAIAALKLKKQSKDKKETKI